MKNPDAKEKAYRYGLRAERIAGLYLRCKGYRILSTRYRNHMGEIDILAARGKTLVAVEVKARQNLESCNESVPPHKQAKIARALEGWLAKSAGLAHAPADNIRFDVIWIAPRHWPVHIKDAWRM